MCVCVSQFGLMLNESALINIQPEAVCVRINLCVDYSDSKERSCLIHIYSFVDKHRNQVKIIIIDNMMNIIYTVIIPPCCV